MQVKINRHSFSSAPARLEVVESISRGSEMRKIGRVVRTRNELLCFPNTPLGLHMSVHDADEKHPMARIHQRIPFGKGVFQVYPPGSIVGRTVGEEDIPPFAQIKGVLPLPPEQPEFRGGLALIRGENLWQQSTSLKAGSSKLVVNCDISSADGLGIMYYFIEAGDVTPLVGWLNDRQDMLARFDLTIEVFEAFVPWLAIVVARGNFAV